MTYTVRIASAARRQIRKLRRDGQERIIAVLSLLADEPRPPASKKLTGRDAWRVRTGNWRVIYEIHDDELLVLVVAAGNRRDVYRRGRDASTSPLVWADGHPFVRFRPG